MPTHERLLGWHSWRRIPASNRSKWLCAMQYGRRPLTPYVASLVNGTPMVFHNSCFWITPGRIIHTASKISHVLLPKEVTTTVSISSFCHPTKDAIVPLSSDCSRTSQGNSKNWSKAQSLLPLPNRPESQPKKLAYSPVI